MKQLILGATLLASAQVAAQQVTCPLKIDEGAIQVTQPPGWRATASIAHLISAGMMSGPPERLGYLIPSKTVERKNGATDTWYFKAGGEKWLWCGYGAETVRLYRRMDDAATKCEITGKLERPRVYLEMVATCK